MQFSRYKGKKYRTWIIFYIKYLLFNPNFACHMEYTMDAKIFKILNLLNYLIMNKNLAQPRWDFILLFYF
jgi:hypothetical protein